MRVHLRGQDEPVELVQVERDDEVAVIGRTPTGKRFVARRESIQPARHPYRIYLMSGEVLRVVEPAFEQAEEYLLGDMNEILEVQTEAGDERGLGGAEIRSLLSAMPNGSVPARPRAGQFDVRITPAVVRRIAEWMLDGEGAAEIDLLIDDSMTIATQGDERMAWDYDGSEASETYLEIAPLDR